MGGKLISQYVDENLKYNFRSRKNIIEFNNQFFEKTKYLRMILLVFMMITNKTLCMPKKVAMFILNFWR